MPNGLRFESQVTASTFGTNGAVRHAAPSSFRDCGKGRLGHVPLSPVQPDPQE